MECGNRLRVGVRAKNASVSGFACRPFYARERKIAMAIAQHYGECSEMLVFPKEKRQENGIRLGSKTYGGRKRLRLRAPDLFHLFSTYVAGQP